MKCSRPGIWMVALLALAGSAWAELVPVVPNALRGSRDFERRGIHDANRIRTEFHNYGMVGNFWDPPVDLSRNHSVEVPKGSGMNYTDGITPFVMARIGQTTGDTVIIMETGYRERQATSVRNKGRTMRFEPRPGYFQAKPDSNKVRFSAISNKPWTWPN